VTQNWWVGDLIDAGALRPLNAYMSPDLPAEYWQAALSNFQRDGTTWGLPATFETVSLFQNTALASAAQAPATTNDLLALSSQITSTVDGATPTLGVGLYANLYHTWWGFPAYGATLFDPSGKVILEQNSGAADFLTWMNALAASGGSFVDTDYGMLIDRFKKGEFAYFVDGPWAIAELRAALGENLSVVPLPAGPAGPAQPWANAEGVIINPVIGEQQALNAWWLATRLTDAAAGSTFASVAGRLPANQRAALPEDPILRGFAAQAATAQAAPIQKEMDAVWGYGGDMLVKVLGGSMEPAAVVQETAALINEETGK
jgi:maltose-binding protein MalE